MNSDQTRIITLLLLPIPLLKYTIHLISFLYKKWDSTAASKARLFFRNVANTSVFMPYRAKAHVVPSSARDSNEIILAAMIKGLCKMKTNFGRGTVYDLNEQQTLAEVYYFIQGAPQSSCTKECQGFLEPILEYQPLADALREVSEAVLELEDGSRVAITPSDAMVYVSSSLPIFFRSVVPETYTDSALSLRA
jgi:hypothetical protein